MKHTAEVTIYNDYKLPYEMTMASSTARSQEDETRNARRNANRNPR